MASPRDFMIYNIDDELITEIFNVKNRTGKFQVMSICALRMIHDLFNFRLVFVTKASS